MTHPMTTPPRTLAQLAMSATGIATIHTDDERAHALLGRAGAVGDLSHAAAIAYLRGIRDGRDSTIGALLDQHAAKVALDCLLDELAGRADAGR